jgi:hypothetical protein
MIHHTQRKHSTQSYTKKGTHYTQRIQHKKVKLFLILKSYLHSRHFIVKVETEYTELSSVPQGSVLRPLLYLLYTAGLPTSPESTIATFADDAAVLATDSDPAIASHKLQTNQLAIQNWFKNGEWKLTNPSRSTSHSLHEEKCAPTPGQYKQRATPPRRFQVYRAASWQETYLAQTHFRKTETTRLLGRK